MTERQQPQGWAERSLSSICRAFSRCQRTLPFMSQELPKSLNFVSERLQAFQWRSDPLKSPWGALANAALCPICHLSSVSTERVRGKSWPSPGKSFLINPIEYLSLSQDNTMYLIGFSPVNS